jgi:hypothetical protein
VAADGGGDQASGIPAVVLEVGAVASAASPRLVEVVVDVQQSDRRWRSRACAGLVAADG